MRQRVRWHGHCLQLRCCGEPYGGRGGHSGWEPDGQLQRLHAGLRRKRQHRLQGERGCHLRLQLGRAGPAYSGDLGRLRGSCLPLRRLRPPRAESQWGRFALVRLRCRSSGASRCAWPERHDCGEGGVQLWVRGRQSIQPQERCGGGNGCGADRSGQWLSPRPRDLGRRDADQVLSRGNHHPDALGCHHRRHRLSGALSLRGPGIRSRDRPLLYARAVLRPAARAVHVGGSDRPRGRDQSVRVRSQRPSEQQRPVRTGGVRRWVSIGDRNRPRRRDNDVQLRVSNRRGIHARHSGRGDS